MLIPKILHYCWFGPHTMPLNLLKNIQNWKRMCPNYRIIQWSENNFNVYKHPFTTRAYKQHNWAFVSDYVRLYALKRYGGIYLDTDVKILKSLDPLLKNKSFLGLENWDSINSGLIYGSVPREKNVINLLNIYNRYGHVNHKLSNFSDNTVKILTKYFRNRGFKYKNKKQLINKCVIYPTSYFCPKSRITGCVNITSHTYTYHYYANSWSHSSYNKERRFHIIFGDIIKRIIRPKLYDFLYNIYLQRK